jgi:hypothetical protein
MGLKDVAKVSETATIELTDPFDHTTLLNDDGSPMTISVYGPYSSAYRQINHNVTNKRLMKSQRSGGKVSITSEEIEATNFEKFVKCTAGWHLTLKSGEGIAEFSQEAARQLYKEEPWVLEQVKAVLEDEKAFLEKSS